MAKKSFRELAHADDYKRQTGKDYSTVTYKDLVKLDDKNRAQSDYQAIQKRILSDYVGDFNSSAATVSQQASRPDDAQWNRTVLDSVTRNRQRVKDTINTYKDRYDTSALEDIRQSYEKLFGGVSAAEARRKALEAEAELKPHKDHLEYVEMLRQRYLPSKTETPQVELKKYAPFAPKPEEDEGKSSNLPGMLWAGVSVSDAPIGNRGMLTNDSGMIPQRELDRLRESQLVRAYEQANRQQDEPEEEPETVQKPAPKESAAFAERSIEELQTERAQILKDLADYEAASKSKVGMQDVAGQRNKAIGTAMIARAKKALKAIDTEINDIALIDELQKRYQESPDDARVFAALSAAKAQQDFNREWSNREDYENFFIWLGDRLESGFRGFNLGIYGVADFVTNNLGLPELKWSADNKAALKKVTEQIDRQNERTGFVGQTAGKIVAMLPQFIPQVAMNAMSAGMTGVAQLTTQMMTAGAGLGAGVYQATKDLVTNPIFINTVVEQFGRSYVDAKEAGDGELKAFVKSAWNAVINGMLEMGGLEDEGASLLGMAHGEGGEEVTQGLAERAIGWAFNTEEEDHYSLNKIVSLDNPDAIINPKVSAEEYAMGFIGGGIMGGTMKVLERIANGPAARQGIDHSQAPDIGKALSPQIAQDIQAVASTLPVGSEARELSDKYNPQKSAGELLRATLDAVGDGNQQVLIDTVARSVDERLRELGEQGDIIKVAEAVTSVYGGQPITPEIRETLVGSQNGMDLLEAMLENDAAQMETAELDRREREERDKADRAAREAVQEKIDRQGEADQSETEAPDDLLDKAREYGLAGIRLKDLHKTVGEGNMTDAVKRAYNEGVQQAKAQAAESEQEIKRQGPQAERKGVLRSISAQEAIDKGVEQIGKITSLVRSAANALRGFAEDTGLNVVLFESPVNDEGQHIGKQGWYDRDTQTVYLDVKSGYGNEEAIMRTAGHEITHFIKQYAPDYYENNYKQNIIDALYEGDPEALMRMVEEQIKKAEANGQEQTISQAMDEVIADASETMLFGGEATLTKLIGDNPKLFVRVKGWIDNFVKALQKAIHRIAPDSEGAKLLSKSYDTFKRIQANWWNAMQEASVNLRGEIRAEAKSAYEVAQARTQEAKNEKIGTALSVAETEQADRASEAKPAQQAPSKSEEDSPFYVSPELRDEIQEILDAPHNMTKEQESALFGVVLAVNEQDIQDLIDKYAMPGIWDTPSTSASLAKQRRLKKALYDTFGYTDDQINEVFSYINKDTNKFVHPSDAKEQVGETKPAAKGKTLAPVAQALKEFPVKTRNLINKWMNNEWINIDPKTQESKALEFIQFAKKWYNAGREGVLPFAASSGMIDPSAKHIVFDDIDLKYPPFLQDTFYEQGKAADAKPEAAKPAPAAEKPAVKKPAASKAQTPSETLADRLLAYLSNSTKFTSAELFTMADKAFGGTQAQGSYTVKDAYDALELAVNKHLLLKAGDWNSEVVSDQQAVLSDIEAMLDAIPTQTKRTDEQEKFQQFSTPPNIAYLAALAANINNGDLVLEPSAGIGGLAVFAKAWDAQVAVNELSARRLEVLRSMGFDYLFNENAEQIDNILPGDIKPTVVIMNPPFSATAGRTASNKTSNAIRHIEQALKRLEPNGRLVAILGRGMADDTPAFRGWWNEIREAYDIRANIGIDGSNYTKYGTSFDVQLVVIDKTGPQTGQTLTGEYKDLGSIPGALEGIRNDRPEIIGSTEQQPLVQSRPAPAERPGQRQPAPEAVRDRDGTGRTEPASDTVLDIPAAQGIDDHGRSEQREPAADLQPSDQQPEPGTDGRAPAATRTDVATSEETGSGSAVRESAGQSDQQSEPGAGVSRTAVDQKVQDDGVFSTYVSPDIPVKAGVHPAKLVESSAMAAVAMPKASYVPKLHKSILKNLSTEQMVAVTYAGQAFTQKLPTGEKKGFFIGDGTGVGKGRTISGIIADSFAQGQKKAVWITKNQGLLEDAVRDWGNTTGKNAKNDIIQLSRIKADAQVDRDGGILFASFDTLRGGSKTNPEMTRMKQITDWLGKDFDGVIVYDEAHNMANLIGKKTNRGKSKGSAKAIAGVELQRQFPNAGIVYTTATAAQEVSELAFAERLGLWGQGTPFADVNDFVNSISSSGLAAMELVSREMKERGAYVARSISYDGVEYQTIRHTLDETQREIYDTLSRGWQKVMQNVNKALEVTDGKDSPGARAAAKSAFYGAVQRFYNQVLTSLSMPSVIHDIQTELDNDRSIVIQVVNTNEAEQERQLGRMVEEKISLDELDLTPRGALINYLEKSFPVNQYEEYTDDNGNAVMRPVTDSQGRPVINREAVAMRDALIAEVEQMKVPQGPLEMLFDAFGTDNVAEITGRKRRVVPKRNDKGQFEYVVEKLSAASSEADAQAFQDGRKRILVFSDAGGTGKSYHADRTAKNQQQRVHYVLQPGWSAKNAVQGFGRTHRTNEASAPIYKLVTTDIKGQKRFVSTIARRLDQLGALTKGQRETGSGVFSSADNLESAISVDSLREFYNQLVKGSLDGLDAKTILEKMGLLEKFTDQFGGLVMNEQTGRDMPLFLNRILALEVDEQNSVFDNFESINSDMYEAAKEAGTLDEGLETIKADKVEIVDDQLVKEYPDGGSTRYVQTTVYNKARIEKSLSGIMSYRNNFMGIYRLDTGAVRAVFRVANKTDAYGRIREQYRLMTPNLGGKYNTWSDSTLANRATLLEKSEWAGAWKEIVSETPELDKKTMHLLTGSLLPVWDKLPTDGNIKVVRMNTVDGQSLIGRVIKGDQVDGTLQRMGYGRAAKTYTTGELFDAVLKDNKVVKLEYGRLTIQRSRVNNEQRLELKGDNLWSIARRFPELFMEKIQYRERYFIPNSQAGRDMLSRMVDTNRVMGVYEGADELDYSMRRISSDDFLQTDDKTEDRRILVDELSDRDSRRISPRTALAGAMETISHTDADKKIIEQYRGKLEKVEADVAALREINAKIKELSFAPGPRDMAELAKLKNNKATLANRIARADSMLTRIENAQPMKQLISHEKRRADSAVKRLEALSKRYEKKADTQERNRLKESIVDNVTTMRGWIAAPDVKAGSYVPDLLVKPLGQLLEAVNAQSKRSLNGGERTIADKKFVEGLEAMQRRLEDYNASINREDGAVDFYLDLPDNITEAMRDLIDVTRGMLDKGDTYIINQMSNEQLAVLDETLTSLKTSIRNINATYTNQTHQRVSEAAESGIDELSGLVKKARNSTAMRFINWMNATPVYAFDRLGPAATSFYNALQDGADKLSFLVAGEETFAEKTFKGKEAREWADEIKTFSIEGREVQMPVASMMSLYSLAKREQAMGHIMGAGIRIANFKHGGRTVQQAPIVVNATNLLAQVENALTDRQKAVADALQKRMSTTGADLGNEVSMKRFGTRMFTEQNYFPIETDSAEHANPRDDDSGRRSTMFSLLNMSATRRLKKNANNRLMVRNVFDVYANHMTDMMRYNSMALPILDMIKWYNYRNVQKDKGGTVTGVRSTKAALIDSFGRGAVTYVHRLLENANGPDRLGSADRIGNRFLGKYNKAVISANLRVALLQPTAFVKAAMVLNPLSMGTGLIKNIAHLKKNIVEMEANSGIALWKQMGFYDLNISNTVQEILKRDSGAVDRIVDKRMWLPGTMDRLTWGALWQAAKDDVSRSSPALKGEAYMEEVKRRFRDMIYRTQVVDSVLTRSEFMRQSSFAAKNFSSFMSEGTQAYNLAMAAIHKLTDEVNRGTGAFAAWKKHGGYVARSVAVYLATAASAAVVEAITDAYRDDDELEPFMDKVLEGFKGNFFNNLLPNIPIVSSLTESAKRFLDKAGFDTYGFEEQDVLTAGLDYFTDALTRYQKQNDNGYGYQTYGWVYKALQGVSSVTGLPMANMSRELVNAWNMYARVADPQNVIKTYNSKGGAYDQLYEAIKAGDKERKAEVEAFIRGRGDTEKDMDTGYWDARKRATGENKYVAWENAVRTGKDLKTVMKEYLDYGVTKQTLGGQITTLFKDEYVALVKAGKKGEAARLKGYLLNAYVVIGYKRDDKNKDIDKWVTDAQKKK